MKRYRYNKKGNINKQNVDIKCSKKWISKKHVWKLSFYSACIYMSAFILGLLLSRNMGIEAGKTVGVQSSAIDYITHNLKSAVFVASGVITVSLGTIYYLFLNGFFLGAAFVAVGDFHSYGVAIASILVHGIFELPAIILVGGIGLYPVCIIYYLLKNKKVNIRILLWNCIFMSVISISLFIIAAILEAYISPIIINWVS
ncbi:stage II sporulation protein M [Bacillus sp. FSL R12-0069]|uniref:stage II sporulation protein M n=1 Tax=Bacillus sp. FSL R12-0069 TaxID=2975342 RepID=UPI0030FC86A5